MLFNDRLNEIRSEVLNYVGDTEYQAHQFEIVKNAFGEVFLMLKGLDCLSDTWVKEKYPREKVIREHIAALEKDIHAAITPENDYAEELKTLNEIACMGFQSNSDINMLCMSVRRIRRYLLDYIICFIDQSLLGRCSKVDWEEIEKLL